MVSYNDIELKKMRVHCSKVIFELNQIDNSQKDERFELLKNLFAHLGKDTNIKSYFQCDYGSNIYLGDNVFINYNCVFVDVGKLL